MNLRNLHPHRRLPRGVDPQRDVGLPPARRHVLTWQVGAQGPEPAHAVDDPAAAEDSAETTRN